MVLAARRLLERETELERLGALLGGARGGAGAFAVVSGSPGVGKTRLARALREDAEDRGFRVLSARCSELERDYAFGVVRQWFEPLLRSRSSEDLLDGAAALAGPVVLGGQIEGPDSFTPLHGLYWLTATLAERAPLALVLDDAQWGDEASLRFVSFLVRRLEDLPVLVLVTVREPAEGLVAELAADASAEKFPLRPLGPDGVAAFLRDRADAGQVDEEFARVCHDATGGNPFLLGELTRALIEAGVPFIAASAAGVPEIGPASVASAVLARVSRLPPAAARLARSVAVLGDDAELVLVAALADIDEDEAAALADALAHEDVLDDVRPLRFVHPIVRSAIRDDVAAGEREALHGRAAGLLLDRSAAADAIAVHLLPREPRGDAQVTETLAAAARIAVSRGAPETAAVFLSRALAEPPPEDERSLLLLELGRAEYALERASASEHLRAAHAQAHDPKTRARAALTLASTVGPGAADQGELLPLLERSVEEIAESDRELVLELEAARLRAAWLNPDLVDEIAQRAERYADLEGKTPSECVLLAHLARLRMDLGRPARDVGPLAERAASPEVITQIAPDSIWLLHTALVLVQTERFDAALRLLDAMVTEAQAHGSLRGFVMASLFRSAVLRRAGKIAAAEADARAALEAAQPGAWSYFLPVAHLVDALIEQARLDEAAELLERHDMTGALPDIRSSTVLLFSRAWLRAERGDLDAALADLAETRRRLDRVAHLNIAGLDGRIRTALIHLARGDTGKAEEEADIAVGVARAWGTPGAIGMALRAQGLVRGDEELLREAVRELSRSPLRLERARALVELGAARRRRGERSAAREPLREALGLADECGGIAVRERAREELAATGVRVRREALRGAASLTPSERRIAARAAEGASNTEIAQALFVTVKTVEMHLSNAYRKLGISSRHDLARTLEG
jgi:DNA-binding CsgD family transcriptional regulator